eukprot:TRINITY_DN15755_c0_g2_i1.p1 TRINITY_DN15755_c0_g2~~TRINITY_DN15755_c0_g2_i1.p1  ORF type:complete len:406 (-),score=56.58 TRINITY_DN15755_c0_g2_i1:224-1441(-)
MVLIDSVVSERTLGFKMHAEVLAKGSDHKYFAISGAGCEDANGVYKPTGKMRHEVHVFENDAGCMLSREPQPSRKTGCICYGWIIGLRGQALYAVKTDSIDPPASGWKTYGGKPPSPTVHDPNSIHHSLACQPQETTGSPDLAAPCANQALARSNEAVVSDADNRETVVAPELTQISVATSGDLGAGVHSDEPCRPQRNASERQSSQVGQSGQSATEVELQALASRGCGAPSRFAQASTEVYAWWNLPLGVSAKDIDVSCRDAGRRLCITIQGVVVFDQRLFHRVRADDTTWFLDGCELNLTLSKYEKAKVWECLHETAEVTHENQGRVPSGAVPNALSASERIRLFRDMVEGDDGSSAAWDDLDLEQKRYVDAARRYKHARATGNEDELALAELDLDELGKLVI